MTTWMAAVVQDVCFHVVSTLREEFMSSHSSEKFIEMFGPVRNVIRNVRRGVNE